MPAGATIAHYKGLGLDLIPGTGLLPACIPGTFDAYMLLLRDYGSWRLADILEPAIGYAENGYPVLPRVASSIRGSGTSWARNRSNSAALSAAFWNICGWEPGTASVLRCSRARAGS